MQFFGLEMTPPPFLDIFFKIYAKNIPFWNQKKSAFSKKNIQIGESVRP